MIFGSVCSGIEAASCAWLPLGWEGAFVAEIEPFPCSVLKHYYNDAPNYGDMTRFKEWPDAAINVLVGGTPCQSFSVAGLRKGLDDPRGNLTLTYLAVAEKYRPDWLVWENVPGVLSDDDGRTFGTFLGALAKLGYGFAYRVLDAQFFRVAQQRRRVFVVASARGWASAGAVLSERSGLSGDLAPSREAGEVAALPLTSRVDRGGAHREAHGNNLIAKPLPGHHPRADLDNDTYVTCADVAPTLNAHYGEKMGLKNQHINGGAGLFVTHSLRGEGFDASEDGTGRGTPLVVGTLTSNGDAHSGFKDERGLVESAQRVRRLTPRECERLQGFPDDYTLVDHKGKLAKDGPRYKALGNSMAVPVMAWIGQRIQQVQSLP